MKPEMPDPIIYMRTVNLIGNAKDLAEALLGVMAALCYSAQILDTDRALFLKALMESWDTMAQATKAVKQLEAKENDTDPDVEGSGELN